MSVCWEAVRIQEVLHSEEDIRQSLFTNCLQIKIELRTFQTSTKTNRSGIYCKSIADFEFSRDIHLYLRIRFYSTWVFMYSEWIFQKCVHKSIYLICITSSIKTGLIRTILLLILLFTHYFKMSISKSCFRERRSISQT